MKKLLCLIGWHDWGYMWIGGPGYLDRFKKCKRCQKQIKLKVEIEKLGRHLSNIFDHRLPYAKNALCYSHTARMQGKSAMDREWQRHLDWINKNVIGRPKATKKYTVEELEEMGMVGIYKKGIKP